MSDRLIAERIPRNGLWAVVSPEDMAALRVTLDSMANKRRRAEGMARAAVLAATESSAAAIKGETG